MKKILFITHETSRTGAPYIILYFMQWLKLHYKETNLSVLSLNKGDLATEFKQSADHYYEFHEAKAPKKTFFQKVENRFFPAKSNFDKNTYWSTFLGGQEYDVIYANTVVSIPIATAINEQSKQSKIIAHIHELNTIIKLFLPNLQNYINDISSFVAPSNLVKNNLVSNWNVPKDKLHVVYEFSKNKVSNNVKTDKQIFTVGASGTVHWRKGSDIFVQIARYVKTHYPTIQIQFVWVGRISKAEKEIVQNDIHQLQLEDVVKFVGEQENPIDFYQGFDVFLLPSREDPFPLVCIEVGMLGKPIICFEKATGTAEIIDNGGGYIVPYLSIEAMAEKINHYYNKSEEKERHGDFNKTAFAIFTPEKACPQLFNIIENTLKI